jgi:hypothetical protein
VVVVNGRGGAGKDTVCEIAGRHFFARTVSAITPVKELAARCGWDGGKDNRSRKFLSDLKRALIEYNDLPNRYLEGELAAFLASGDDVLFAHIREGAQIDDFRRRAAPARCAALLVRSPAGRANSAGCAPIGGVATNASAGGAAGNTGAASTVPTAAIAPGGAPIGGAADVGNTGAAGTVSGAAAVAGDGAVGCAARDGAAGCAGDARCAGAPGGAPIGGAAGNRTGAAPASGEACGSACPAYLVADAAGYGREERFGNDSDDNVEDYAYDYCYDNDKPLCLVEEDFMAFFRALLEKEGLLPRAASR